MLANWRAKSLVAQVSKYLLNGYFLPDSLVPYSFRAAQEREKLKFLSRNLVETKLTTSNTQFNKRELCADRCIY